MIICHRCGTSNQDNFNCCYNCGAPLKKKPQPTEDEVAIVAENIDENQYQDQQYDNQLYEDNYEDTQSEAGNTTDEQVDEPVFIPFISEKNKSTDFDEDENEDQSEDDTSYNEEPVSSGRKKKIFGMEISVTTLVALLIVLLIFIGIVWGTISLLNKIFSNKPVDPQPSASIDVNDPTKLYAEGDYITETDIYGDKRYKVVIRTNGDFVYCLNELNLVSHGSATLTLSENQIFSFGAPLGGIQKGETCSVDMTFIVTKEGFEDYVYTMTFLDIAVPMVPFEMTSPASPSATTYKTNTVISFKTARNAKIYINGVDYTSNLNTTTGEFSTIIRTPIQESSYLYEITIESADYVTRTIPLEITRSAEADPDALPQLTLDQVLYIADDNSKVKVTGTFTGAHSDISFYARNNTVLTTDSIMFDEDGEGKFTAILDCPYLGISEITAECAFDFGLNKTFYVKNMSNSLLSEKAVSLYSNASNFFAASSREIKESYSGLMANKLSVLSNKFVAGYNYKCVVKEIKFDDTGVVLVLDLTPDASEEKLLYVSLFTETTTFAVGDTVKIFGNGSVADADGTPRMLAVATYKTKY